MKGSPVRRLRWGIFVAVLTLAPAARADRAVVMPTNTAGFVPEREMWTREFDRELVAVLKRSRIEVLKPTLGAKERSCRTLPCLRSIAERNGSDMVVAATIANDDQTPPTYHAHLVVFDSKHPDSFARELDRPCPRCSERDAADLLSSLMNEALGNAPSPQATAERPGPEGDKPGTGSPPVAHPGSPEVTGRPSPPPGQPPAVRLEPRPVRKWLIGAGAGGVAAGVVLLGVGGKVLSLDGQAACGSTVPASSCDRVYDSVPQGVGFVVPGAILALGGVAAIVTGAILPPRRVLLEPSVSTNGAGLSLHGSW